MIHEFASRSGVGTVKSTPERTTKRWDDHAVATLVRMLSDRKTRHEIADRMGVSPASVSQAMGRLNLSARPPLAVAAVVRVPRPVKAAPPKASKTIWSPDLKQQLVEMREAGTPTREIGAALGCSISTVKGAVRRYHLTESIPPAPLIDTSVKFATIFAAQAKEDMARYRAAHEHLFALNPRLPNAAGMDR